MDSNPIEKRGASQRELLRGLYDLVHGCADFHVKPAEYLELGCRLGLHPQVTKEAIDYLVSEELLAYCPAFKDSVSLTHKAISEVEHRKDEPNDMPRQPEIAILPEFILGVLKDKRSKIQIEELKAALPDFDHVPDSDWYTIIKDLVSDGMMTAGLVPSGIHGTVGAAYNLEITAQGRALTPEEPIQTKPLTLKQGVPLKVVTLKGECFEVTLDRTMEGSIRIGLLYHFHATDLKARRGRRLVSVFASATLRVVVPTYEGRINSVLLNKLRSAFDSGQLTFDGPHDANKYTELILQPEDFKPHEGTADDVQSQIRHQAYWIGFRYNTTPNAPIRFDNPTHLEYLGVSAVDLQRYLALMEKRGLLERVTTGAGAPTLKLIDAAESVPKETDEDFARMALEEAKLSVPEPDGRKHPRVGVVIVKDGRILARAHRGEFPKEHAEFIALERKLENESVVGATVYATLEPCTTRNHPKVPCAERLVERGVARVFIGMLDPNRDISGKGQMTLSDANIETQFFPPELMSQIKELNRDFIREQKQKSSPRGAGDQKAGLSQQSSEQNLTQEISEITLEADYVNRESDSCTFACRSVSLASGKYVDDTSADGSIMRSEIEPPALIVAGVDMKGVRAMEWTPTRLVFKDARTGEPKEFYGELRDTADANILKFAIRGETDAATKLMERTPAMAEPLQAKPNAIAYAWYETTGETALKAKAFIRPSTEQEGWFTFENSFGEEQHGTKEEIALRFASFDKGLTLKHYIRMQHASSDPAFALG
jgi:pyrimidine deaminase RibD-like protein